MEMRFTDHAKEKTEKMLNEAVKNMNPNEREKCLDFFATDLLKEIGHMQKYEQRAKNFRRFIKDAQLPAIEGYASDFSCLGNPVFIPSDLYPQLFCDLVSSLRSDLPNRPLLS